MSTQKKKPGKTQRKFIGTRIGRAPICMPTKWNIFPLIYHFNRLMGVQWDIASMIAIFLVSLSVFVKVSVCK